MRCAAGCTAICMACGMATGCTPLGAEQPKGRSPGRLRPMV
jgi:hypothetical protein